MPLFPHFAPIALNFSYTGYKAGYKWHKTGYKAPLGNGSKSVNFPLAPCAQKLARFCPRKVKGILAPSGAPKCPRKGGGAVSTSPGGLKPLAGHPVSGNNCSQGGNHGSRTRKPPEPFPARGVPCRRTPPQGGKLSHAAFNSLQADVTPGATPK